MINLPRSLRSLALALAFVAVPFASAQHPGLTEGRYLLVSDWANDKILRFDALSGLYIDDFVGARSGGLDNPSGMAVGRDGHLYVASSFSHQILRYDGNTGAFLGVAASQLGTPLGLQFNSAGNFYVASRDANTILEVDPLGGATLKTFAAPSTSVLWWAYDIAIGPDDKVYLSSFERQRVLRFEPATGDFIDVFANSSTDLERAGGITFGPDNDLYLATFHGGLRRFDGTTGEFIDFVVDEQDVPNLSNVAFGPDGNLYVTSESLGAVFRYDGDTGNFMDVFTSGGSWNGADFLLFTPPVPEPSVLAILFIGLLSFAWKLNQVRDQAKKLGGQFRQR